MHNWTLKKVFYCCYYHYFLSYCIFSIQVIPLNISLRDLKLGLPLDNFSGIKDNIQFFITGCRDAFTSTVGRFAFGGSEVSASSVQDCGNKCLSSGQTCYGYDWDGKCFLHLNRDNLNNLQTGTGVTNYRRQFTCNPTNQPPGE